MAFYSRGSTGPEVQRIQKRLKELGLYVGPADGVFGGGTESSVKVFQSREGLTADGVVGARTWQTLFDEADIPAPVLVVEPLERRVLALTGSFETSCGSPECFAAVTGDFDGQGISFGALQWNIGRGTLQPLLLAMEQRHAAVVQELFHSHVPELLAMLQASPPEQLAWAQRLQTPRRTLVEPWLGLFKSLGRRSEFQQIQLEAVRPYRTRALALCERFGVRSQRAFALMFDIAVQNGSISDIVAARIRADFERLPPSGEEGEAARLEAVARRRAEAANPRWVADVMARKLTIARGKGTVHGRHYNLDEQYGISLRPM
jgi:hypothetical protein